MATTFAPRVLTWVDLTPTIDTSAYASGDTYFVATAISNAAWRADQPVNLRQIIMLDEDDQAVQTTTFLFFDAAAPALGTINVAPNITDANARTVCGAFTMEPSMVLDLGASKLYHGYPNIMLKPVSGTRDVYVAAIVYGTPTNTASGIKLRFGFES
jgi:hypothetical protein